MLKRLAIMGMSLFVLTHCSSSETTSIIPPGGSDMSRSELNVTTPPATPTEPVVQAPYDPDPTLNDPYTYFRKKRHPRSAAAHPKAKKHRHKAKKHKASKRPVQSKANDE